MDAVSAIVLLGGVTMFEADDFAKDPYGYATNQAGHACIIGIPAGLVLLPFIGPYAAPVVVALVYGGLWEVVIQRGKLWRDSIEDTAHVMAGASIICGATVSYWTVAGCVAAWLALIAIGFTRRWKL